MIVFIIFIGIAVLFELPSLDAAFPDLLGFFLDILVPTFPALCIRKSWRVLGNMNRRVRSTPSRLANWITWHLAEWQIARKSERTSRTYTCRQSPEKPLASHATSAEWYAPPPYNQTFRGAQRHTLPHIYNVWKERSRSQSVRLWT